MERFTPHEIQWTPEKTKRLWDYYSSTPAFRSKYFGSRCGDEVARLIARKLLPRCADILDYSCGRGDVLSALSRRAGPEHRLFGCDFSRASVHEAEQRLQGKRGFAGLSVLESLPSALASESFDLVVATEVLEHLTSEEFAILVGDIRRILRPGKFVFATTPFEENLEREKTMCPDCGSVFHRWQHQRSWSVDSISSAMAAQGFAALEARPIQWGPLPIKLYCMLTGRPVDGLYYIGRKL